LVTAAEPYPRGSLIGGLLNPLHKTIHETTMAVAMAPHEALYGSRQRGLSGSSRQSRCKGKRHSDSDSDSDSSSSSSSSSEAGGNDLISQRRRAIGERRGERGQRREERGQRREERKRERRERKHGKVREGSVDIPSGRFRLILCYWDGHREVS